MVLNSLLLEINGGTCPMRVPKIDGNQDHILLEDIDLSKRLVVIALARSAACLLRPFPYPRLLIARVLQFGKEESIEIMDVQRFPFALLRFL